MAKGKHLEGCLPTNHQELLLKACLLQGEAAINAWYEWKAEVDIEQIDHDSHRLLPLLYQNLSHNSIQDQLLSRYKNIYRQTWYKNQIIFHCMADVLRILRDEGIPGMILKGGALTLQYYKDFGLRPMDDFDIMVPTTKARQTINLLTKFNWQPKSPYKQMYNDAYFSFLHADIFKDSNGRLLDLHWHTILECRDMHADDAFWEKAVPVKINKSLTAQTMCPADQLLHIIVHGICWNPRPLPRWVADAMMVLNSSAKIDWDRLILQAKKRRLTLHLKNSLNYLRYLLGAPIPLTKFDEIQKIPISNFERREWYWQHRSPEISAIFFVLWFRISRLKDGGSFAERLIGFAKYMQFVWRVKHLWQLPVYFIIKSMRRIWRHIVPL